MRRLSQRQSVPKHCIHFGKRLRRAGNASGVDAIALHSRLVVGIATELHATFYHNLGKLPRDAGNVVGVDALTLGALLHAEPNIATFDPKVGTSHGIVWLKVLGLLVAFLHAEPIIASFGHEGVSSLGIVRVKFHGLLAAILLEEPLINTLTIVWFKLMVA